MKQTLIVRGAPQEYECQVGAWEHLSEHLQRRSLKKILVFHGNQSWQAAKKYFPDLKEFEVRYAYFGGECSDLIAAGFQNLLQENEIEGIVAVGGGKVADLGKLVAHLNKLPILILPTLAATCAAYTPLSVVYNQDGSMDRYDIFPVSNALVLIEPRVILESPIELMIAGIGDTLAKWYEAHTIIDQLPIKSIEIKVAEYAAKQCQEVLLKESSKALDSMRKKQLSQAFLNVVETNILLGGMVGGFGDDYGRTAGAHSIHDALTLLPKSHQQLHGNKVAYGVLVQLVIENKWTEIESLIPFYQALNLPLSLKAMNLVLSAEDYRQVAERATEKGETIHFMKEEVTAETVEQAMQQLEKYMEENS